MRALTIVVLLLSAAITRSQWITTSIGTGTSIDGIDFVGPVGVLVTDEYVLRSTNSGASWSPALSVFGPSVFRDVDFADANTVYCGGDELVYKSIDAGQNWSVLGQPPSSDATWGVSAPTPSIAYYCGVFASVWKTTNGGSSFTDANTPGTQTNWDIHFTSASVGFAAANPARIYRTQNGGNSWTEMYSMLGGHVFHAIHFPDAMHGCAVGSNGVIATTSDGGDTWIPRTSGTTDRLRSVHFHDVNNGMAVGWGSAVRTTDGGVTWSIVPITGETTMESVYMFSPTSVIIGTQFGEIHRNASLPVAVETHEALPMLPVHPNPTEGRTVVTLPLQGSASATQVLLYDATGRQVLQHTANFADTRCDLDLSPLGAGEYHGIARMPDGVVARFRVVRMP